MQNFQLLNTNIPIEKQSGNKNATPHKRNSQISSHAPGTSRSVTGSSNNNNSKFDNKNSVKHLETPTKPDKKVRRVPRRTHAASILSKSQIEIASPAGQRIISISNSQLAPDYQRERIDRYERSCAAPPIAFDGSNRPKFMDKKFHIYNNSSFRSSTKHFHSYKFPRRQYSTKFRDESSALLQRILVTETNCQPLTINVERLTNDDIETMKKHIIRPKVKRQKINPKSPRPSKIADYIDLCTDEEESCEPLEYQTSEDSNESVERPNANYTAQLAQEAVLFVDCAELDNDAYVNSTINIDTLGDQRLQPTNYRSPFESASNKMQNFFPSHANAQPINLFAAERIKQDKENHLYHTFVADQSSNGGQNNSFLYENEIENGLDINARIPPTAIPSNSFISIDLTL